jgi:O-antigen ligase
MKDLVTKKYLGILVLLTSVAVTALTTPFNSIDPVNLPKLTLLGVLSFSSIGFVLADTDFFKKSEYRIILILIGLFIAQLVIVFLADDRYWGLKLYGAPGRNTGLLAYLSLSLLLVASLAASSFSLVKKFSWALVGIGLLLGIYGVLQSNGVDFFEFDNAYSSNVFGTFGNPNFQSAFMGIIAAVALTLAVFSTLRSYIKVLLFVVFLISIYNITLSSQQGYLNFLAGLSASILFYLFKTRKLFLGWTILTLSLISFASVFMGILNKGPLGQYIYDASLQARSYYWRGAMEIILSHPLIGTGMDSFGEWYRRSWPGISGSTDTTHNIPLEIGANGGIPLMLLYLLIVGFTLRSIIRVTRREESFDVYFSAVVAAWFAYQAQSIISINQLGLGVWGWSLTGLIIGYEINTGSEAREPKLVSIKGQSKTKGNISTLAIITTIASAGLGAAVAVPPYLAATNFYNAIKSGEVRQIENSTYKKPFDRNRFLIFARGLQENKLESQAIEVLRDASKVYPDSIDVWRRWSEIPSASADDIARAKAEMKRLDPYNPDLK